VLDLLTSLVEKSLVVYEEDEQGAGRYRLLEPMRQYSRDRLVDTGEGEAVRGRHRDWYLALAEQAEAEWHGPKQVAWVERLEIEHDNLRAALAWCEAEADGAEAGLRLGCAIEWFWMRHGHVAEGRRWLAQALAREGETSRSLHARALTKAGWLAKMERDYASTASLVAEGLQFAREANDRRVIRDALHLSARALVEQGQSALAAPLTEEGLALAREMGERDPIAYWLDCRANVAASQGDEDLALSLHMESLALFRELGHQSGIAQALVGGGWDYWRKGNIDQAKAMFQESLDVSLELGSPLQILPSLWAMGDIELAQGDLVASRAFYEEAVALARALNLVSDLVWLSNALGDVACRQGDFETATVLHQEGLAISQGRDNKPGIAWAQFRLGIVAQKQGDYPKARALHAQSLALWQELGHHHDIPRGLEQLAAVAEAEGQSLKAARILGAISALREAGDFAAPPAERAEHDQRAAALRAALGEAAFAAAWAEGRAMSLQQAIEYALAQEGGDREPG
jgi:tetratricopeptide (TPR) repeat protein